MNLIIKQSDSILQTIKELLGISEEDTAFDVEISTHINSTFLDLQQIGIGPIEGFSITGHQERWADFCSDQLIQGSITTYIYLKVKLVFDPPTSSSALDSFAKMIDRLEWRLNLAAELNKDGKEPPKNE